MADNDDVRNGGVSRRTMLKRSALVGGSLVWVAPAVQSISGTAFADTTTGSPKPGAGIGPSNVVILVNCTGTFYTAKIDRDTSSFVCGSEAKPPNAPVDGGTARAAWDERLMAATNSATRQEAYGKIANDCGGISASSLGPTSPSCFQLSEGCVAVDWIVFDGALGGAQGPGFLLQSQAGLFPAGWEIPSGTTDELCFSKPA